MKKYLITLITSLLIFCINLPGYAISYTYDSLNRLTHTEYQTGQYVAYNYDPAGNLLDTTIGMTSYHIIVGASNNKIYIYSPQGELQHTIDSPVARPLVATLDPDNDKSDEIAIQTSTTLYELDATISNATLPNDAFIIKADVINDETKETITGSQTTNQITVNGEVITVFDLEKTRSRNTRDRDDNGNNNDKQITICFIPPGNPAAKHTKIVSLAGYENGLKDKSTLGPCDDNQGTGNDNDNQATGDDETSTGDNTTTQNDDDTIQNFGVSIAVADTDLNGKMDIVAAMANQGSRIEILTGDGVKLSGFTAYESLNIGVIIAAGQLLNDALPEIVTAPVDGSEVTIFDMQSKVLNNFTIEGTITSLAIGKQLTENEVSAPTVMTGNTTTTDNTTIANSTETNNSSENQTVINTVPTCSSTAKTIMENCQSAGDELPEDIAIQAGTSVSNVTLNSTNRIEGRVSNSEIKQDAIVEGGTFTGEITNNGTLKNIHFTGHLLKGGVLAGIIYVKFNGQRGLGLGYIQDVELAEDATLIGGVLRGFIKGNPEKPALILNAWIRKGAKLSHVRLGRDVELERGVEIGEGVEYEHITLEDLETTQN